MAAVAKKYASIEIFPIRTMCFDIINYSYLVVDLSTHKAVLIDPSWERNKINMLIHTYNAEIVGVFLTHSHYDHVNLAEYYAKIYSVPIMMSRNEIETYKFRCMNLLAIDQSYIFEFGKSMVEIVPTPGHTFGSICCRIGNNVFTGDTLFVEGCGICFGLGSSATEMYYSLKFMKSVFKYEDKIYPGHSFGKRIGECFETVLRNNIYLQIDDLDLFIKYRMRNNQKFLMFT